MIHRSLLMVIISIVTINLYAQVTVGADLKAAEGALLNLKENNNTNENSDAGLLLPRVKLEVRNELFPMFEADDPLYTSNEKIIHTGLTVYNLTTDVNEDLCPGPYVWDGSRWNRLWEPCSFFDFLCETMGPSEYTIEEQKPFSDVNYIYYSTSIEIDIPTPKTISYGNGLSITITEHGKETDSSGYIIFDVEGDNTTTPGTYTLPLANLIGSIGVPTQSFCIINVTITEAPPPPSFDFLCNTMQQSAYTQQEKIAFSHANSIEYNSNKDLNITTEQTVSYGNGLSIRIPAQNLTKSESGNFIFYVQGSSTTSYGTYTLSLANLSGILGITPGSCDITVEITATPPSPSLNFLCNTLAKSEYTKQEKMAFYEVNSINYNSNTTIAITTPKTISYGNGLSITIPAQTIAKRDNGTLIFAVSGNTATSPGTYTLPLANLSSSLGVPISGSCVVTVKIAATPPQVALQCGAVYVSGYKGIDMASTPATSTAQIPYTLTGGGSYVLQGGEIGTHKGVTAYVETQTLGASGNITVKFSGTPTEIMRDYSFSIGVAGATCSITLSVIKPPKDCENGTSARAFVFQQSGKWYVVGIGKLLYGGFGVAQTIECNSEEEALRHPEALQYCGTQTTGRCIKLFNREGAHVGSLYMSTRSAGWAGGIAEGNLGCQQSIEAYSGSRIKIISFATGYLGATKVTNGRGYLGITTATATLTTKGLR